MIYKTLEIQERAEVAVAQPSHGQWNVNPTSSGKKEQAAS